MSGVALIFLALFATRSPSATSASSGWAIVASPSNGNSNLLHATTCTSAADCWAVGDYFGYQNGYPYLQTLIEHWNGTSWAIVSSPNTSPTQSNDLGGVACASASDCWAVGNYTYYYNSFPFPTPYSQTLIQHWDGTAWTGAASPNTSPTESNLLSAVACTSASDCWAVGSTIQRWNGTSWSIFTSPIGGYLKSVTCLSGSDCWAVGGTLIEHWDGASWTVVPEPGSDPEGNPDYLGGVTCASASDCWAVGSRSTGPETGVTLIEHWNGSSWVIVPSPNPQPDAGSLSSVACASASQCWAIGSYFNGSSEQTIIEQWNGSSWAIVSSPNPSSRQNRLRGVACASTSECWAVGDQLNDSGADLTLIEEYTASPSPTPTPAQLQNISTRLRVQTGDNALIGGFIITGTEPKKVIVRALGPSISSNNMPVPGRLADPVLELHIGSAVATNDNWKVKSDGSSQQAEIEATGIPPTNDLESALVRTLSPGPYTAVMRGNGGGTGIGLVEVYDLSQASASLLANISSRGFFDVNDNAMIGGFIAGPVDRGNPRVVVRALGPSLSSSGVPNTLQDPTLELHDGNGNTIASNDDWPTDPGSSSLVAAGLAPSDTRESAIFTTITPGQYTAIVSGVGGTTGVGLVEVYNLQ